MEALGIAGPTRNECNVDYSNDSESVIITGTLTYDSDDTDGDSDIYPVYYIMNISIINFVPVSNENIEVINGSLTSLMEMESIINYNSSFSGNFSTVYIRRRI